MEIKTLSTDLQAYLRSGFTIVSPCQAVLELVYNSLDAGAKSVAVRADLNSSYNIQVIDDGFGIDKAQMDLLGQRYMTSKCHSLADLSSNLTHYGYRGEYLASLKQSCEEIVLMSRAKGSKKTYMKILKPGESPPTEEVKMNRHCHGMTVVVKNLLCNYPVRQRIIKHNLELERVKRQLMYLCPMHPQVSFTVRDDTTKQVILTIKKRQTTKDQVLFLISNTIKFESSLIQVTIRHKYLEIDGYVSREPITQPEYQNIYINKRLVSNTLLHDTLNKLLVKSFYLNITKESNKLKPDGKTKYAVYFVNIRCPYKLYEMISQPTNEQTTFLEFTNWKPVFKALEIFVLEFLKTEDFSTIREENVQNQKRIKTDTCNANDACEQNQMENIEMGPSEIAHDIYSLRMVENFKEHTREVKIKAANENTELNSPHQRNEPLTERDQKICVHNNTTPNIDDAKDSQNTSHHFEHESSAVNLKTQVRTLQSKIRQIEQENRRKKKKEKKKVATSFHSGQKHVINSVGKLGRHETHRGVRTNTNKLGGQKEKNKVSKNTSSRNAPQVFGGKNRKHKKSADEKCPGFFSNETLNIWNSAESRVSMSQESTFSQPLQSIKRKVRGLKQEEQKFNGLTTNVNIPTGVDTRVLAEHKKGKFHSDHNINSYANDFKESCSFGKFYEICNTRMNISKWFTSKERNFINQTPMNECHLSPTPIKMRRKNKRQELLKQRQDKKDCRVELFPSNKVTEYATLGHAHQMNEKSIQDGTHCTDIDNVTSETERVTKKRNIQRNKKCLTESKAHEEKVHSEKSCKEVRSDNREETNSPYNDNLAVETNHDYSVPLQEKTASHSHVCESHRKNQRAIAPMSNERDMAEVYLKKHLQTKSNREFHQEPSKQRIPKDLYFHKKYPVEQENSHCVVTIPDKEFDTYSRKTFKPREQMSHQCDDVDILDSYIDDVLSRSYRANLQVESQKFLDRDDQINFGEMNDTDWMCPRNFSRTTPNDVNQWSEMRDDFEICDRKRRTQFMESMDGVSDISQSVVENIWENNSSQGYRSNLSNLQKYARKRSRDSSVSETFPKRDLNSNVLFSPYFNVLKSGKASVDDEFLSKSKQSTLIVSSKDTDIFEGACGNLKPFVAKPQASFKNSTFFRNKFSLTPVLQSSNSNPYLTAENRFDGRLENNIDTRLQNDTPSYQNLQRGTNQKILRIQHLDEERLQSLCNVKHMNKHVHFNQPNTTEVDQRDTIRCFENRQFNDDHETCFENRQFNDDHETCFENRQFNDDHETCFENRQFNDDHETCFENRQFNDDHETCFENRQFNDDHETCFENRQFNDDHETCFENRQFNDDHETCFENRQFNDDHETCFENRQFNDDHETCFENRQFNDDHETTMDITRYSPIVPKKNAATYNHRVKNTFEDFSNKQNKTKRPLAQNISDMEDIALLDTQVVNNAGLVQTDENQVPHITFNSHPMNRQRVHPIVNDQHQSRAIMRQSRQHTDCNKRYELRNLVRMDYVENWLTTIPPSPVPKNTTITGQNDKEIPNHEELNVIIDERNSIDNNMDDDTQENFEAYIDSKVIKTNEFDEPSVNLDAYQQSLNTELTTENPPVINDGEIGDTVANEAGTIPHHQPGQAEWENSIALADTAVIETNIQAETADDISVFSDNHRTEHAEVGEFMFNPLGLVSLKEPLVIAPTGCFQLKDRYGFMNKGLSPLVLANSHTAGLGQLEGSELEDMENVMPTPETTNSYNNCIDKIVSVEEVLVKTHLKSSLLNSMCHVSKDLLNVKFKVIAQVDNKYIVVLLNKSLLVAFDQHAVDERIRVEKLFTHYRNEADGGSWISHPITPCVLNLSGQELSTIIARESCLHYFGLFFQLKETGRCVRVTHVPKCLFVRLQKEANATDRLKMTKSHILDLIKEILFNKTEIRVLPSSLVDIINMEACRGAIMFGKTLPLTTCYTLVKSLTRCKAPFQCAHGRPSVAPLADIKLIANLVTERSSQS